MSVFKNQNSDIYHPTDHTQSNRGAQDAGTHLKTGSGGAGGA